MNRERAKELLPVIEHFANGGEIEFYNNACDQWNDTDNPGFFTAGKYRIKETPDSIDWGHVHESVDTIARDRNDQVCAYSGNILVKANEWMCGTDGICIFAGVEKIFTSYKRGTVTWDNSLITRPEGE